VIILYHIYVVLSTVRSYIDKIKDI
jgi:hypothetical protein